MPSGASTGVHEALELRDGDKTNYLGRGVLKAVDNVNNKLADELCGMDALDQVALDRQMIELDGTENEEQPRGQRHSGRLGGGGEGGGRFLRAAAVPLSRRRRGPAAACPDDEHHQRRQARRQRRGRAGVHDHAAGVRELSEAIRCGCEVFHNLKKVLQSKKLATNVGDEGGFAPDLKSNAAALEVIVEAVGKAGYELGKQVFIALDPAASEFYDAEKKRYSVNGKDIDSAAAGGDVRQVGREVSDLLDRGRLAEDDWDGWKLITERLGDKIQLVGDDVFVTNTKRLQRGIDEGVANSILIKVNQIGTLTETIEAIELARRNGYTTVISHRSGETEDCDHRRPGRGDGHRPDQDRLGLAHRPHGQVQPTLADRGNLRRRGHLRRAAVPPAE